MLMGMSAMIGYRTKIHHVLSRFCVTSSFYTVDLIRKRLTWVVEISAKSTFHDIPLHEISVSSIDNLDLTNQHGLLVRRRNNYGLYLTAIQGLFFDVTSSIPKRVVVKEEELYNQMYLTNGMIFIYSFAPNQGDVFIEANVSLFVGAVYKFKHRAATAPQNIDVINFVNETSVRLSS